MSTHNYCGETKRLLVEDSPFKEIWLHEEDKKRYLYIRAKHRKIENEKIKSKTTSKS